MSLLQDAIAVDVPLSDLQKNDIDLLKLLSELKDYSIVMLNAAGKVVSWNAGAENIFGYKAADIIGKHVSVFYTPDDIIRGRPEENLAAAIEKGRHEFEVLKCRKDGTRFYSNTILKPIYNTDKTVKGFAKVTRDISVYKKLEKDNKILTEQLEEKVAQRTNELLIVNKELEAFSYSVSHDLRAPLRAVSGFSAMLKKNYKSTFDAEANRIVDVIVTNTKMMGQLIDDLLSFSRMARIEAINKIVDMEGLAKRCIGELLQTGDRTKYSIRVLTLPACTGDESMLKQVWYNLVDNAVKYSSNKDKPEIEIGSVNDDADNNVYYVKDNGAGFDMKYVHKLFGVFQRLHRQDEFEGTGLGLALANRIITKHGGRIWVQSTLNEGAVFYFSIPKIK